MSKPNYERGRKRPPSLRVVPTVGNYWRVVIHGEDNIRDGPANYAEMDIGRGATKADALAEARAWFDGMKDEHHVAAAPAASPAPPAQCPHGENCACAISTRHEWFVAFCEERDKLIALRAPAPAQAEGWQPDPHFLSRITLPVRWDGDDLMDATNRIIVWGKQDADDRDDVDRSLGKWVEKVLNSLPPSAPDAETQP